MHTSGGSVTVAPALRALVEDLFDYAGLFPPAGLSLSTTLNNYDEYRSGDYSWMLRSLVVAEKDLPGVPTALNGSLSVLTSKDEPRAGSLETKHVVQATRPVYCEVPVTELSMLDEVKRSGCFAKIRTGGVKPDAIPSVEQVAAFMESCADRRLPFKATAGLHHAIRAQQLLTYDADAPRAVMHGFVNVLMAAAFAWHGDRQIADVLAETDPSAFTFSDVACWRNKRLACDQIVDARRNFMHSIGSCSFMEPVEDLHSLGFL